MKSIFVKLSEIFYIFSEVQNVHLPKKSIEIQIYRIVPNKAAALIALITVSLCRLLYLKVICSFPPVYILHLFVPFTLITIRKIKLSAHK